MDHRIIALALLPQSICIITTNKRDVIPESATANRDEMQEEHAT